MTPEPMAPSGAPSGPGATARRALVTAAVVAAVVVGLLFLWHARDVLLLVFAGVLLGILLRRLARIVSDHTPLPPTAGLALVVIVIVGALVAAFWLQGDTIARESAQLREDLPRAAEQLRSRIAGHDLG